MKMLRIITTIERDMPAQLFEGFVASLRTVYPGVFQDREAACLKEHNEVTFSHDLFGSPAVTTIKVTGRGKDETLFWPCGQMANA